MSSTVPAVCVYCNRPIGPTDRMRLAPDHRGHTPGDCYYHHDCWQRVHARDSVPVLGRMKTGKVWGTTHAEIETPVFALHRLEIAPNMRCSFHVHDRKWNAFIVMSGRLFIDVEKNDYALTDETVLGPGDVTTVAPGEFHRFRTGDEGCIGFEMYYIDGLGPDIRRKDHGGPVETPAT